MPGHADAREPYPYSLKDQVWIVPVEQYGRVTAQFEDSGGIQLRVRYFFNGEERNVYFLPDELLEKKP